MENSRQENSLGLGLQEIGTRWLGGIYSPSVRVLSHEFAQRMASLMMDNLKTADRFSFVVYVSHEVYIAAFMFHWFGIYPSEWVEFLEGFILQLTEDKMIVYTKNGKQELYYPYWWNF
jgi:hypothetical protein